MDIFKMLREPPGVSKAISIMLFFAAFMVFNVVSAEDDSMGPVFVKEPPNRVDFSNGTGAVVECQARGTPQPDIIWLRADGSAVGDVPGLRQVLPNGNLVFPPFRAEDYRQEVHAQVYSCLAKSPAGSVHSRDVNVRAVIAQQYAVNVMDEQVLKGNAAIFKCHVPSFNSEFVEIESWLQDETTAIYPQLDYDGKYLVLPSGELHIRDVGPEDGYKTYQCRTKHRLTGETRLSATKGRLVITEPASSTKPKFPSVNDIGLRAVEGLSATILCLAQAYPIAIFRTRVKFKTKIYISQGYSWSAS